MIMKFDDLRRKLEATGPAAVAAAAAFMFAALAASPVG